MANYLLAVPLLKSLEGGLSNNPDDSASKYPAPWPYMNQTGWHTNKGITYATFESLAPVLGYSVTAQNFFQMPDAIWNRIFKSQYWDGIQGDTIASQAIADTLVDFAFNSGVAGALRNVKRWLLLNYNIIAGNAGEVAKAFNRLSKKNEKTFFDQFIRFRESFYIRLDQPANQTGWENRLYKVRASGLALLHKHKLAIGAIFLFAVTTSAAIYLLKREIEEIM